MKFNVSDDIFNKFPTACLGVVVATGINSKNIGGIGDLLDVALTGFASKFPEGVRNHPSIAVWRKAFTDLGLNPNKFMSSVEALSTRVYKTGKLPNINNLVDLINALSLKYILPMGAHDIGRMQGDICLRLSKCGDIFTPFGSAESEKVPEGEFVYADDLEVRTRRWVWRQGEKAKIHPNSEKVFFPIDGFSHLNKNDVIAARDELAAILQKAGAKVNIFYIDRAHTTVQWPD